MESLSPVFVQTIIQLLGLPGLIFIVWHFDNKRLDKQREVYEEQQRQLRATYEAEHRADRDQSNKQCDLYEDQQRQLRDKYETEHKADREQISKMLALYRDDIGAIKSLYANNAHLVTDYGVAMTRLEKMAGDMMSVVSLNSQASTQLADAIKNNTFCPQVRVMTGKQP